MKHGVNERETLGCSGDEILQWFSERLHPLKKRNMVDALC